MALDGFQKRLRTVLSEVAVNDAFKGTKKNPPRFIPIAPVETLKRAYSKDHEEIPIAVANWASSQFNRASTFAMYLTMESKATVDNDAKISAYFSMLSQTPDIDSDMTVAEALATNDEYPLFSAAKVKDSPQVYLIAQFEEMRAAAAAAILSETPREEKDIQDTVLSGGDSTPTNLIDNKEPLKKPMSPVLEELPDADDAKLPFLARIDESKQTSMMKFRDAIGGHFRWIKNRNFHLDKPNPLYAIMLLHQMLSSIDPDKVSREDTARAIASFERLGEVLEYSLWSLEDVSQVKTEIEDLAKVLQNIVEEHNKSNNPNELFNNFDFLRFVAPSRDVLHPETPEDYQRIDGIIPRVFEYLRAALNSNVPVDIMDALETKGDPPGVIPDPTSLANGFFASMRNTEADSGWKEFSAAGRKRAGAPGGDPNPGNGTGIAEDLDSGPSTARSGRGVPFPGGAPSAPGGVSVGVPRKRAAYDHTIVRVPMFRPMQPYYLVDMGYMDTTSGQFNGKSLKEIAIRQGDLIFRYKDKNSTPAVTVNWNRASFWGIAAAAKASFFAGDKVTFPVALGGGMSTINRAPSAVAPFDVLTPNANRYTDEWMDNSKRRVGSLEHTFKDDPCIVSLNWAQPGHQLDVIVYY